MLACGLTGLDGSAGLVRGLGRARWVDGRGIVRGRELVLVLVREFAETADLVMPGEV